MKALRAIGWTKAARFGFYTLALVPYRALLVPPLLVPPLPAPGAADAPPAPLPLLPATVAAPEPLLPASPGESEPQAARFMTASESTLK